MSSWNTSPFVCPHCRLALACGDGALRCANNHSFDLAREGYANLLPVNRRRSRVPGDSAEMVQARRRFLEAGHFDALHAALAEAARGAHFALDVGCGEGFFTSALAAEATTTCAIDIARPAVRMTARRLPGVHCAVASSADVPLADGVVDALLVAMAPLRSEAPRLLRPGGRLLRVTPAPQHLHQFKSAVYAEPRPHAEASLELDGFMHRERVCITGEMELGPDALGDLLAMTPVRFRSRRERQADLLDGDGLRVTIAFNLDCFERESAREILDD